MNAERSRWRVTLQHPLRSAYVHDSREKGPLGALAEVELRFRKHNPSLNPTDFKEIRIVRVHEEDDHGD